MEIDRIVANIKPFTAKQTLCVTRRGQVLEETNTTVRTLSQDILALAEKYSITKIALKGPKLYTKGIGNKILSAGVVKYKEEKLTVEYL